MSTAGTPGADPPGADESDPYAGDQDGVDETSEESFPASDPPGSWAGSG